MVSQYKSQYNHSEGKPISPHRLVPVPWNCGFVGRCPNLFVWVFYVCVCVCLSMHTCVQMKAIRGGQILWAVIVGIYRWSGMLCGCWNLGSYSHDHSVTVHNFLVVSLAPGSVTLVRRTMSKMCRPRSLYHRFPERMGTVRWHHQVLFLLCWSTAAVWR